LPRLNQRCLILAKINLQSLAIVADGLRCGFFDSAAVQVHADRIADLVPTIGGILFGWHGQPLYDRYMTFRKRFARTKASLPSEERI
jgi:hypothetical protein